MAVAADPASGPAADGALFAFQRPGGVGFLLRDGATLALPGRDPALAAGLVGWREGARIVLANPATLAPVAAYDSPGGGAFAFSDQWVVWLVGTAELVAQPRNAASPPRVVARARGSEQLGRPGLAGQALVFHRAGRAGSRIRLLDLGTGREQTLRSERRALLTNPAFDGSNLLYVRSTYTRQELRLGPATRRATTRDRRLLATTPTARRDAGRDKGHHRHRAGYPRRRPPRLAPRPPAGVTDTLWTTALGPGAAYVTRLRLTRGRRPRRRCSAWRGSAGETATQRAAVSADERQLRLGRSGFEVPRRMPSCPGVTSEHQAGQRQRNRPPSCSDVA